MSSTPVVPGLLYQVKSQGQTYFIFSRNPVDALCVVLEQQVAA